MTTALRQSTDLPLAPVTAALRAMFGTSTELPGLAPDLLVHDHSGWAPATSATAEKGWAPATSATVEKGWAPATSLAAENLDVLLDSARRRWNAQPHAAAALAWKAYTYWLALPAVLGWAGARRVPLLTATNVLVHFADPRPLITIGLRHDIPVAVLPGDPLALSGHPRVKVVADETALLAELSGSLLDGHLGPLLDEIHGRLRLGRRILLGSLASGVAYGVLRSADTVPGSSAATIARLLGALGIDDLIDLVPDRTGRLDVQRKTCCLAFTLPQPKVCRGCCLNKTT